MSLSRFSNVIPARLRGSGMRLIIGAVLLLAVGLLYGGHAAAPMVFDDLGFFGVVDANDFVQGVQLAQPRYWSYASFAYQAVVLGQGIAELRLGNFVLHGLSVLVLQMLLARLLATLSAEGGGEAWSRPESRHEWIAFAVALLFALHPAGVYAVAYLVQRTTLMATLFALLTWLSFLRALQQGGGRWLGVSIVCYYLAAFSKQHAVLAPVVSLGLLMLYWQPQRGPERQGRRPGALALLGTFAAYAVIALSVTLLTSNELGTTYEPLLVYFNQGADWHQHWWGLERVHWMSIQTQSELFFKYLWIWLWPDPAAMSIDMREAFLTEPGNWQNWGGVIAYQASGALALGMLWQGRKPGQRQWGLVGLGLLTVWGTYGVELSTVRLQEIFVLYRSYLWMTGLAIIVAVALDAVARRRHLLFVLVPCLGVAVLLAGGAQQRLLTLGSSLSVWDDAVRLIERRNLHTTPQQLVTGTERAYKNRATAYALAGDYPRAFADYGKAIAVNPKYCPARQSRGAVLGMTGYYDEALADLTATLVICPDFAFARVQYAVVLERLGRKGDAIAEFGRACSEGDSTGCAEYRRRQPGDPH